MSDWGIILMARAILERLGPAIVLIVSTFPNSFAQSSLPPINDKPQVATQTETSSESDPIIDDRGQTSTKPPKKEKRGSIIIAPIPIVSPAVGSGVVLVFGYVFKVKEDDQLSPPSVVGVAGAFTNNGSGGGGIGGRLYFAENKYQTTFVIAKGHVNFDWYGIGRIPGRAPLVAPLTGGGTVFFGEFMRKVGYDLFVGPRYQHRSLNFRLNGTQTPGGFEIPAIDLKTKSVAIGFHVQRDKRDSTFYPTKGMLFDAIGNFFDQAIGSRRQYQTYKVEYNGYHAMNEKQVLAYRGMICSANQSVPFYDLCLFGFGPDLRGYTAGQFQNRRMFATQAELRRELKGRFGFVAFGGVGSVAHRWNEFRTDQFLPEVGAGLRFNLNKKHHINYRIDWAVGRAGHTLSIGIGEAF